MASWAPPLRTAVARPSDKRSRMPQRELGVLRLGDHIVSDRDARLLARRLDEVRRQLAANHEGGPLCAAARFRVAEDIQLVTAALERKGRVGLPPL
jgi:hypothetical protein